MMLVVSVKRATTLGLMIDAMKGLAYEQRETSHEHDDFGGVRTDSIKTCRFCGHSEGMFIG